MRQYYQILGLPSGASELEVKKRYRELVMRFHPDVNSSPSAHEDFIKIKLAYEKLMGDHVGVENLYAQYQSRKGSSKVSDTKESEQEAREQMRARAREYAKAQQKEAEEIELGVFNWLTRGIQWKLVRTFSALSVLFGLIMLVEFWVPAHTDNYEVRNKVHYQYFQKNTLFMKEGGTVDVPELVYLKVGKRDHISLEYSPITKEFLGYRLTKPGGIVSFIPNDFNFFFAYPLLPFFFLIPGILFFFRKNATGFYLLYFASMVAYPGLIIHYMFREQKLRFIMEYLGF